MDDPTSLQCLVCTVSINSTCYGVDSCRYETMIVNSVSDLFFFMIWFSVRVLHSSNVRESTDINTHAVKEIKSVPLLRVWPSMFIEVLTEGEVLQYLSKYTISSWKIHVSRLSLWKMHCDWDGMGWTNENKKEKGAYPETDQMGIEVRSRFSLFHNWILEHLLFEDENKK